MSEAAKVSDERAAQMRKASRHVAAARAANRGEADNV
jgi:hypothetical protein